MRPSRIRAGRVSITSLLFLGCTLLASACTRTENGACGPFGDPPAKLYRSIVPKCARGTRLGPWHDADGTDRYACLYEPPQASATRPLPLVVYLHPSLVPADSVENWTNFLGLLASARLSNDDRPGFILLAPEGRNTHHYYNPPDASGPGWDNWYRQFSPAGDVNLDGKVYRENVDAAAIDHFIAAEISGGKVARERIYVSGWSNGGAMAYAYGLSRPTIAAVGVYSAPDPYELKPDPCPQIPVASTPANDQHLRLFNVRVPNYQVHNNCDIAGICPNALFLEDQLRALGGSVSDTIIDHDQHQVAACDMACGASQDGDPFNFNAATRGTLNHLRWPGHWTSAILDFFRRHPLR